MMGAITCLVCGSRQEDVSKMHYFPASLERSRLWLEKLGISYTGQTLKTCRICSNHFTRDAYQDIISYKLKRDAVPISFEDIPSTSQVRPPSSPMEHNISNAGLAQEIVEENVTHEMTSHTSSQTAGPSTPPKTYARLFRGIKNLTRAEITPRKQNLIRIIHKKEDQLRKIKSISKKRNHSIKALSNLTDSNVVKNLFKDMSSVTANFMISQVKNAKVKGAQGRRWAIEDKIVALCIYKRSPRCYSLLRKFVAMPHKRTLTALHPRPEMHTAPSAFTCPDARQRQDARIFLLH